MVLVGGQGTGKSHLSKVTIRLVDPNVKGVERMPSNLRDLAVAAQDGHLLAYDNLRHLTPQQSDTLCIMARRQRDGALYTDDDLKVMTLHSAVMLNSIGGVIDQPDLAQRCLPLRMEPMTESARKSEVELLQDFERDVPAIQRGIFDLIAEIVAASPLAVVSSPQRMIDFSRWLAALEIVDGAPSGTYQNAYAEALTTTPSGRARRRTAVEAELTKFADHRRPPREWPDNEIALQTPAAPSGRADDAEHQGDLQARQGAQDRHPQRSGCEVNRLPKDFLDRNLDGSDIRLYDGWRVAADFYALVYQAACQNGQSLSPGVNFKAEQSVARTLGAAAADPGEIGRGCLRHGEAPGCPLHGGFGQRRDAALPPHVATQPAVRSTPPRCLHVPRWTCPDPSPFNRRRHPCRFSL
ncbi:MAG: ATP-binding protein [Rubrivivax sp.]|nr:ATP-binding protein [Rubrivivax sp.]